MKKFYFIIFALLFAVCLAFNGANKVYGWGTTAGDGSDFRQLQETAVFFNNSGQTMSAGQVVLIDLDGTGVAANTTLGAYVELAAASGADSILVVGVVKSTTAIDQGPVVVVTKGPVDTMCADSSDAVTSGSAVGTSGHTLLGQCGGGTNLGVALEAGDGADATTAANVFIWVDPTGAD